MARKMNKYKNIIKKSWAAVAVALVGATSLTSCYEEPDNAQPYGADEQTIYALISQRQELSAFNTILKKCAYDKKLSTYLEYTCFAPMNDGVSKYLDSLYADNNVRAPHNGIAEAGSVEQFKALDVMTKVSLMSDSLCEDICKYHMSGNLYQQMDIQGGEDTPSWNTLLTGRTIKASTFTNGQYKGKSSLNGVSAIIDGDIKALNGVLHVCSNVVPRSDRTVDEQMNAEGDMKLFFEALQRTGLYKVIQQENKGKKYDLAATKPKNRSNETMYSPEECLVKWTVFAETDEVFAANGIHNFDDLKQKCIEWYANPSWYDYVTETGQKISTGDDYENPFNVVNMFVAYHILRAGMPVDKIVYEKNSDTQATWNLCFGYEAQEYFETLLKNTLLKVWCTDPGNTQSSKRYLFINRYRQNNTLTDQLGTFGDEATHPIIFEGVKIDREKSKECKNGYIHRIGGILLYDQNAKDSQNERLRLDSSNFLYETINNGIRFMTDKDVKSRDATVQDVSRVAFDNTYFDNVVCYNPNTKLVFCKMGAWRANNSDQFQGWAAYDFAIKLPPVPTGTYEVRIVYPCMSRNGLMQFYIGNSPEQSSMISQGIPFDAKANPELEGSPTGYKPIMDESLDPQTDYGVAAEREMHVRGYMYAPASFSRAGSNSEQNKLVYDPNDIYSAAKFMVNKTSCRSEAGFDSGMMLRHVITTIKMNQSQDYWLRIKNLVNNENLGWSFDFIELCPSSVYASQQMNEDWY